LEGNKNDVIKSPDDLHELEHLQWVATGWTTGDQFPAGAKVLPFATSLSIPALGRNQPPTHCISKVVPVL
jgi:hypothetical protein